MIPDWLVVQKKNGKNRSRRKIPFHHCQYLIIRYDYWDSLGFSDWFARAHSLISVVGVCIAQAIPMIFLSLPLHAPVSVYSFLFFGFVCVCVCSFVSSSNKIETILVSRSSFSHIEAHVPFSPLNIERQQHQRRSHACAYQRLSKCSVK